MKVLGSVRLAVAVAVLGGGILASAGPALAVTGGPSFSWTGGDVANGNAGWSDPANWSAGKAPKNYTSGYFDFPTTACSDSNCLNLQSDNDLTGVTAKAFTMEITGQATSPGGGYNIYGNAFKISGMSITSDDSSGTSFFAQTIQAVMKLTGSEGWTLSLEDGLNLNLDEITGSGDSLQLNMTTPAQHSGGFLGMNSWQVGPLTFTATGGNPNSIVVPGKSLNGNSKASVTFDGAGLFSTGPGGTTPKQTTVTYGPTTFTASNVQLGNGGGNGPYGLARVEGAVTFDSASNLILFSLEPGAGAKPVPGVDYPQLAAQSANLGAASLTLFAGCNQVAGTKYTIVTASGGITGTFGNAANDSVISTNPDSEPSCSQPGAVAPSVKIHYGATSVTATVVAAATSSRPVASSAPAHYLVLGRDGRVSRR